MKDTIQVPERISQLPIDEHGRPVPFAETEGPLALKALEKSYQAALDLLPAA